MRERPEAGAAYRFDADPWSDTVTDTELDSDYGRNGYSDRNIKCNADGAPDYFTYSYLNAECDPDYRADRSECGYPDLYPYADFNAESNSDLAADRNGDTHRDANPYPYPHRDRRGRRGFSKRRS